MAEGIQFGSFTHICGSGVSLWFDGLQFWSRKAVINNAVIDFNMLQS